MVMEKPSAQLVGREFVRQYYTLLNQAPDYLHRYVFAQRSLLPTDCHYWVQVFMEPHSLTPLPSPSSCLSCSGSTGRTHPTCTAAWTAMGSQQRQFTDSR